MMKCLLFTFLLLIGVEAAVKSSLVSVNSDGSLSYAKNSQGDRLMDFSSAGYKAGQNLPSPSAIPNKVVLKPSGKDDTAAIQQAIDQVSKLPVQNRFRGAVLLGPGTFTVSKSITISASGVVLRGSGTSQSGTTIQTSINNVVVLSGRTKPKLGNKYKLVKKYVPFGGEMLELQNANGLKAGDSIYITSTITGKLISFLGMDKLVRDGKKQVWIKAGSSVTTDRTIVSVKNNNITLDAAFPDSIRPELFDSDQDLPFVQTYSWPDRMENSGVENLRSVHPKAENNHQFASIDNAINCWARNLYLQDFLSGVVTTGPKAKFVTIQSLQVVFTAAYQPAAPPQLLSMEGTQILHRDTNITGGGKYWPLSSGSTRMRGPVVHYNINIDAGPGAQVVPHMRWSTGMLYDNVRNPKGNIAFSYRATMGSGHGWTMAWGVMWNCEAATLTAQNPYNHFGNYEESQVKYRNWLVGGKGKNVPGYQAPKLIGTYDSPAVTVTPQSLYLTQLAAKKH